MIRLRQTFGAHAGRVLELDGSRLRLGRLPDSEVAFDPYADLDASGRHAEIRLEGGRYRLIDLASRNGTFLNGSRIREAPLGEGDEIEIGLGGPRLRVEWAAPGEVDPRSLPDLGRPMSIPPTLAPPGRGASASVAPAPPREALERLASTPTPVPRPAASRRAVHPVLVVAVLLLALAAGLLSVLLG